jgi:mono/diheme cytochrome c family protein
MNRKIAIVLAIGLTAGGLFHSILYAQMKTSVWDGIYTEDQAKGGETLYRKECASCHGDDLAGVGQTPPLSGKEFKMDWDGLTVGDLYERMRVSMPADHPGTLSPEQNAGILAYLLKSNEFPPGNTPIRGDTESLKQIRFETAKPK